MQEMGAKERSEKLRRRKSSLEEEGQRGNENGVFALSRGKGRAFPNQGGCGRRSGTGRGADGGGGAVSGVPGDPSAGGPT